MVPCPGGGSPGVTDPPVPGGVEVRVGRGGGAQLPVSDTVEVRGHGAPRFLGPRPLTLRWPRGPHSSLWWAGVREEGWRGEGS